MIWILSIILAFVLTLGVHVVFDRLRSGTWLPADIYRRWRDGR